MKILMRILKNKSGLYRIAFSLCILCLSIVMLIITDNTEHNETSTLSEQNSIEENEYDVKPNESEVEQIVKGLQENEEIVTQVNEITSNAYEEIKEYSFSLPVYGAVLKPFSADMPVYSKTMDDWRIHNGIDISCPIGSEIYAAEDGIVSDVGYDINFGHYVVITCGNYTCRYTSMDSGIKLAVGDSVSKGQSIGIVSDSCVSEICDDPHFHFEMQLDGQYVDPSKYILFE